MGEVLSPNIRPHVSDNDKGDDDDARKNKISV